jgi:hypothetical protein
VRLVGKAVRSGAISEPTVVIALVVVSLAVVVSLVAVDVTDAVIGPGMVGVPETGHEMVAPGASEATGNGGVQVPTVTPGGRLKMAQVGLSAGAVAVALFVHSRVPE